MKINNYLKMKLELKYGKYLEYYLKQIVRTKHFFSVKFCKCFKVIEYNFEKLRNNGKSRHSWTKRHTKIIVGLDRIHILPDTRYLAEC